MEGAAQHKATIAWREEMRFLDDLVRAIPGIFYVLDEQGRLTRWNRKFCEVTGYSDEETGQLGALDLFEGEARELIRARMRTAFEHGEATAEAPLRTKDGRQIPHYFTGRRTIIGGSPYLVGLGIDLSERVAAERRRRESEDKLRGLYELSPLGIALQDWDGRHLEFNEAFRQISGYPAAALSQLDWKSLTPEEYLAEDARQMETLLHTGRNGPYEKEYLRADGSRIPVRLNGMLITGSEGERYVCSIVEDITRLKEHERELEHMAHFDVLTNVPNRVLLADRLAQAIAQTRRNGTMLAICYLDLDGFKPINDRFGHDTGDRLLVEIASRLKECLRGGDTVARMGGDEFVLLLLGLAHLEECEAALGRILAAVSAPLLVGAEARSLSASLGVTVFPADDANGDTLIRHADQAMYLAKQAGKNRYHLFDPEQDRRTRAHLEMVSRVGMALDNREFVLHYQPKVNMRTGAVVGAEALVRWQHPAQGLLRPAHFLPAIENNDHIVALGNWVVATALAQVASWHRAGLPLTVSVNVAARHLLRHDFVQCLREHLAAHPDAPPGSLQVEVLETAALEDLHHVAAVIRECQAMGVGFALDDFGTGYSSLTYLKLLPVQTLKIDRSFVRDVLGDPEDLAIVAGIIGLSGAFGRSVVAEGLETVDHGVQLLELGCELAQGYGIARPMPADALPAWARAWHPDPRWAESKEG